MDIRTIDVDNTYKTFIEDAQDEEYFAPEVLHPLADVVITIQATNTRVKYRVLKWDPPRHAFLARRIE